MVRTRSEPTSGIGPRQPGATSRSVRAEETGAAREPDIDQSGANMSSPAPFRSAPELVELSEVLGTRSQVLAALNCRKKSMENRTPLKRETKYLSP